MSHWYCLLKLNGINIPRERFQELRRRRASPTSNFLTKGLFDKSIAVENYMHRSLSLDRAALRNRGGCFSGNFASRLPSDWFPFKEKMYWCSLFDGDKPPTCGKDVPWIFRMRAENWKSKPTPFPWMLSRFLILSVRKFERRMKDARSNETMEMSR